MNPVIRDKVLDICLDKPTLADALHRTAKMEEQKVENGDWNSADNLDRSLDAWTYSDTPIRASHIGTLLDKNIIFKTYDSNSSTAYRFTDVNTVLQAIQEFQDMRNSMDSFEHTLFKDAGTGVELVREGNEYFIDDGHNKIRVPPNKLQELYSTCKKAWRHEELRRLSEDEDGD